MKFKCKNCGKFPGFKLSRWDNLTNKPKMFCSVECTGLYHCRIRNNSHKTNKESK